MVVGRSLRPAPDAVAALLPLLLMGVGRERAELSASCPAHAASAPRTQLADVIEEWPPPPRRSALGLLLMGTRLAPG